MATWVGRSYYKTHMVGMESYDRQCLQQTLCILLPSLSLPCSLTQQRWHLDARHVINTNQRTVDNNMLPRNTHSEVTKYVRMCSTAIATTQITTTYDDMNHSVLHIYPITLLYRLTYNSGDKLTALSARVLPADGGRLYHLGDVPEQAIRRVLLQDLCPLLFQVAAQLSHLQTDKCSQIMLLS